MRLRPAVTLVYLATALAFAGAARADETTAQSAPSAHAAAISVAIPKMPVLQGSAALNSGGKWEKEYQAGQQALQTHRYAEAETRLQSAWWELRKRNLHDMRLSLVRLALGEAELAQNKLEEADKQFVAVLTTDRQNSAPLDSDQHLKALNCATRTALALYKFPRAQQLSEQAMNIVDSRRGGAANREIYTAQINHSILLIKGAHLEEATDLLSDVVKGLDETTGNDDLLQEAVYNLGISIARQGDQQRAEPYFARAFELMEKLVTYNRTARHGSVKMVWEDGSPRARQMWDPEYPLKYVHLKNIRVATTIVRSENLVSVLISIANCGKERVQVGVGDVRLQMLSPVKKYLVWIDGNILDRTLEEDHVNNLTWRRRWLAHIQKTRRIPGYLKDGALSTDNFFGNNVFGPYGHWPVMAYTDPAVVTREQYYFDASDSPTETATGADKVTTAFANNSGSVLKPTFLDPGDARTGVVYFQRERFDSARLQISLGNTIFEFPFSAPGGPSGKH